jgi:NAD(P)-dependent dehydrogenase (short-subunit alcohol dehydrogenase family)
MVMAETRVALVTGANRGIGREVARQLAGRGLTAVIGARDAEKGRAAAAGLAAAGAAPPVVALDVADAESIRLAVAEVEGRFGRLDVLVNNAGIVWDGPSSGYEVLTVPSEIVAQTFVVNTLGPLRLIQAVAPLMRKNRYGRIVNLSSGLGQLAEMGGGWPAYRISKAALNVLTRVAAAELAGDGIKVNSACPGWVQTDMGGPNATSTVAEGADTAVWLATLPEDGPTGGFFRDRRPIPW